MGCRAHPLGARSRWGREPWVQIGLGPEVGLGPVRRACTPGPGARRRGVAGARAGWRLHSNGLRSLHTLAPLDPGRGRELGTRGAGGGQIQGPEGQGRRSARAVWGWGAYPGTHSPLRPCPNGGLPGWGTAGSARGGLSASSGARLAPCPAGPRVQSRGGRGPGGVRRGRRGDARPRARNPSPARWPGAGLPCLCVA